MTATLKKLRPCLGFIQKWTPNQHYISKCSKCDILDQVMLVVQLLWRLWKFDSPIITCGCGYTQRSQHDYFTKRLWIYFSDFSIFHMKEFLNEIFYNFLLKINIVASIDHMFWVNHCWINMNISKCVNFARFCVSFWTFIIILNHTKIC